MEPDIPALTRLSENFESALNREFADAVIAGGGGREIRVHRGILSTRSPFFKKIFTGTEGGVKLELKDLTKDSKFEVSFDALVAVLGFLYSGRVRSLFPDCVCVCVDDECDHVACWPVVDFAVQVIYASIVFEIPELIALYQRHLLDILDKIAADDILEVLSMANIFGEECDELLTGCIENIVRSDVDTGTLEKTLPDIIVNRIVGSRKEFGFHGPESSGFSANQVKKIHKALDYHDIDLVERLVRETPTLMDDECALHYAVAYFDAKIIMAILDLATIDNVNHKNSRGYTALHIAVRRKEPMIIMSLLTKGAERADLTSDGRKALTILKRLTSAVDYHRSTEQVKASPLIKKVKASPKDWLCIEILEQAERKYPFSGEASASLGKAGNDLQMELQYLESRASMAMNVAQVNGTPGDLHRLSALATTVELAKHYFPRCSEVINNIVDDPELQELLDMDNETPEEHQRKKRRYMEHMESFSKALHEDKEEYDLIKKKEEEYDKCHKSIDISAPKRPRRGVGRPNGKIPRKK